MTRELPKQEWKEYFEEMSREMLGWLTKVEVFEDEIGAQILSEGLPLKGVMFEKKTNGESEIELMLGENFAGANHQTHTIFNPTKAAFLENDKTGGGMLEIEDANGAKTLVEMTQPISIEITYMEEAGIVSRI